MTDNSATQVPIELLRKYDRPGPRYTSYPTAPEWSNDVGESEYTKALASASELADTPLSIYCHVPFCRRRCYYCGCNTCVVNERETVTEYIDAMLAEIDHVSGRLGERRTVNQLHFGGGTPTYLTIDELARILNRLDEAFVFADGCEKSIEIDPRVTTMDQLDYLASRGFNRVSLGVQDLNPEVQKSVGRVQSTELVKSVIDHCRSLDLKGVNIDLIYGLPRQTVESYTETLTKAIELGPDRVAVYSFAYLPKRLANQSKIVREDLPNTETKYRLFAKAVEIFTGAGYRQIGMDHFARPEDELSLAQENGRLHRNFMGYTVKTSPDMIGLGMSSIGYINDSFFQNYSTLKEFFGAIGEDTFAVYRGMVLSDDDLIRQHVISSLMCNFTLPYESVKSEFGVEYREYFKKEHARLREFFEDGLLTESEGSLDVTPVGRTFVRNIAMTYDAYLRKSDGKQPQFSRTI